MFFKNIYNLLFFSVLFVLFFVYLRIFLFLIANDVNKLSKKRPIVLLAI